MLHAPVDHLSFWGLAMSVGALWVGLPLPATFDAVVPHLTIDYQEPTIATIDGDMKQPRTRDVITCGPTSPSSRDEAFSTAELR